MKVQIFEKGLSGFNKTTTEKSAERAKQNVSCQCVTTAIIHCCGIFCRKFQPFCYLSATAERILRIFPQRNHSQTVVRKLKTEFQLIKKALIISLILNSIIIVLVPEGHGGGIMILFETLLIPILIENGIDIEKINFLENNIGLAIMLSLIGKLILISSLFVKKIFKEKIWIKNGLFFLLISFLSICYKAWNDGFSLFLITIGSGIPFVMYFGRVLFLITKEKNKSKLVTE